VHDRPEPAPSQVGDTHVVADQREDRDGAGEAEADRAISAPSSTTYAPESWSFSPAPATTPAAPSAAIASANR
jgi:hypothetical protein